MDPHLPTEEAIPAASALADGGRERIDRFRAEIAGLDLKAPEDDRERVFLLAAIVLMVMGGVVILGGWFGASGTEFVNKQIPYLVSGGLLGLGLVVAGGALFVRYSISRYLRFWLVREIYEQRAQTDRLVESLSNIETLLNAATRPRPKNDQPASQ